MKFGKRLAILAVSSVTLFAVSANAQMGGAGIIMGQQSCPYNVSAGDGAASYLDEYNDVKKAESEEKAKLNELNRKRRNLKKSLDKSRQMIEKTIDSKYTSAITEHIDNLRTCEEYDTGDVRPVKTRIQVEEDGHDLPPADGGAQKSLMKAPAGFSPKQWQAVCQPGKGVINAAVCTTPGYAASDRGGSSPKNCKDALDSYRKDTADLERTETDIKRSESSIADYKSQLPELLRDAKQRYKEDRQAGTESEICLTCLAAGNGYRGERQAPNWAGVAANVGTGLLAMYMGYQQNKMVAQYNSAAGWQSQSYPTWGYGLPFLANGLYGALGGGIGGGAFGCGGANIGGGIYGGMGGGAFGYPSGMFGAPYGGGMYAGGMGPWGGGIGGGIYGGLGGGMMNPYGMGGGMMNPYGMGGMMNPYGMGGMMNPYGMGGMMNPYGMGGMMNPYGMGGMDGSLGSMQMQQAMMQMQQQQTQLYMQQYQQQMQNQMARQQTMAGLQSELYNLMYRIQQVQYGYGSYGTSLGVSGGFNIGGGFNTIGGTGNPNIPIPAPGNGVNTGTGVLPATGTGGGVVIPAGSR